MYSKRFFSQFIAVLMGISIIFAIKGFAGLNWEDSFPWVNNIAFAKIVLLVSGSFVLVSSIAFYLKKNVLFAGALVMAVVSIIGGSFWSFVSCLCFFESSAIIGEFVRKKLFEDIDNNDGWLVDFLAGSGIFATLTGLLAHLPVNYSLLYGFAVAIPLLLNPSVLACHIKAAVSDVDQKNGFFSSMIFLQAASVSVGMIFFVTALMPELGYDALVTHLFVPAQMAARHEWGFDISTYCWAVMPMLGDWIFTVAYMLDGETASRLVNVGYIFVLAALVWKMIMAGGGTRQWAWCGVLVLLSSPLVYTEGCSLFIESVWASMVVGAVTIILRICISEKDEAVSSLATAGLLLGFALSAKAVTFTILPPLMAVLLFFHKRWLKRESCSTLLAGLTAFFISGGIPYMTAWIITGNPLFPFFNSVFKSLDFPSTADFNNSLYNHKIVPDLIYRITFDSARFIEGKKVGAAGFQWLLLFPASFAAVITGKRKYGVILVFVGVIAILLTFRSQSYLRYIFPGYVLLVSLIGIAGSSISEYGKLYARMFGCVCTLTILLNIVFMNAAGFYGDFHIGSILGENERRQYLDTRLPTRNAIQLVNLLNTDRTPVGVFADPVTAGLVSDALYPSWYNIGFEKEIMAARTEKEITSVFTENGIYYIILDSEWIQGDSAVLLGEKKADVNIRLEKRSIVEKATTPVADFGTISVRKIKHRDFSSELLKNTDFSSPDGWNLTNGATYDMSGSIIRVNVDSPALQAIDVKAGRRYRNSVTARASSEKRAEGRMQINWIDEDSKFIRATIQVIECDASWKEYSMEVTAPPEAVRADVYTSGHTSDFVDFKKNSFCK